MYLCACMYGVNFYTHLYQIFLNKCNKIPEMPDEIYKKVPFYNKSKLAKNYNKINKG